MKKKLMYGAMAALFVLAVSCKKDDDNGGTPVVTASPIKSLVYSDGTDSEAYGFIYDAKGKVTGISDVYDGDTDNADTIKYDYSVANQLTITKEGSPTVYNLDASGRVVKEIWDDTSWAAYAYDADGYLITVTEHYDGADHLKNAMTVTDGNITQILTYGDDGVTVSKTKTFSFTSGDNVNEYQQDNVIDSNWKSTGGIFGKPNKKLMDYAEYWNAGDEANKGKTTYSYTFDTKNRPLTVTKAGDGFTETYTLGY